MLQTPLHNFHQQSGATLVDFAGWEMPVTYEGLIAEHNHTRESASIFDVSHMGRVSSAVLTPRRCLSISIRARSPV